MSEIEQAIRVGDTRRENAAKVLATLGARRERLDAETRELALPVTDPIAAVAEQLEQENADLAGRETALADLNAVVQSLQERHRVAGDTWQQVSRALADREARSEALAALQAKIDSGKDSAAWLAGKGLAERAPAVAAARHRARVGRRAGGRAARAPERARAARARRRAVVDRSERGTSRAASRPTRRRPRDAPTEAAHGDCLAGEGQDLAPRAVAGAGRLARRCPLPR